MIWWIFKGKFRNVFRVELPFCKPRNLQNFLQIPLFPAAKKISCAVYVTHNIFRFHQEKKGCALYKIAHNTCVSTVEIEFNVGIYIGEWYIMLSSANEWR